MADEFDTLWPRADGPTREKYYDLFLNAEGGPPPALNLEVIRENRNGRTFSTEAMEELFDQMAAYVAARMQHEWKTTGKAPHRIRFSIDVEIES